MLRSASGGPTGADGDSPPLRAGGVTETALTLASFSWMFAIPGAAFVGMMVLWRQIDVDRTRRWVVAAIISLAVGVAALGAVLLVDPGEVGADQPASRGSVQALIWLAVGATTLAITLLTAGSRRALGERRRLILVAGFFICTIAGLFQLLAIGSHLITG